MFWNHLTKQNMKKIIITLIAVALILPACGAETEKERFIDASVELGCVLVQDPELFQGGDIEKALRTTQEIFAKHGFDTEEELMEIANIYEHDEDVVAAIREGAVECGAGTLFDPTLTQ